MFYEAILLEHVGPYMSEASKVFEFVLESSKSCLRCVFGMHLEQPVIYGLLAHTKILARLEDTIEK